MKLKEICQNLNPIKQCKEYNLSIWQCPSFLFPLTGLVTIIAMISTYFIAINYAQPEIVALIVIGVSILLTIIGYLITKGFEDLAQANRLKTEFVSIASHQLRTPLTGIKWTIDLIRKTKKFDQKEILERISEIDESNQRMIRLVNDLLDMARVEQGRMNLKPQKIFLDEIIQDLIEEYKPLAKASNIKLILQKESDIPIIKIDFQGIGIVVRNLIDNAIKYTRGGGVIRIVLSKNNNKIRCEIQDEGVGIPKKDHKNIFYRFFRSKNIMKYQTIGSGLGLFIAKAVIEESNGEIDFLSEEGKGTTFWFELPIN
ncbi:MAG: HAMP domain-containing histidine kinase [Candidatus Portnoybacteria bacterium]|nr:HAMP domain-containing histidine kinase [Candidatus Portnoybacteria bacterium]